MGYPPNRQHDYLRLGGKERMVSAEKLAIYAHGRQILFHTLIKNVCASWYMYYIYIYNY